VAVPRLKRRIEGEQEAVAKELYVRYGDDWYMTTTTTGAEREETPKVRRWKVVWVERFEYDLPYQQVRDERLPLGAIYVIPEHVDERELWGDDWDDCPEFCNAGPPYGALRIGLRYGQVLEMAVEELDRKDLDEYVKVTMG
jgi:hypothetical protein